MKNILILIVAAAVYLHFYPQPKLEAEFEKYKQEFLSLFSDATDTGIRLKSDKIFKDLEPQFNSFTQREISKLKEITSTRANVKQFYQQQCNSNKGHPVFHPTNIEKVCNTIANYESLL